MIDLAVIPVAGRGTNLLPLTKSQPKEMLPIAGKPVVQFVVEELAQCGVRRMLFITGSGKSAIENHFDIDPELIDHLRRNGKEEQLAELAFERDDTEYFYTRQRRQLGLGHAVLCAEPFVRGQRFVLALGDTVIGKHSRSDIVRRMVELYEKNSGEISGVIAFTEAAREDLGDYGVASVGEQHGNVFELADLIEKPPVDEAPSNLAVAARYVFSSEIFTYLRKTKPGINDDIQLTDAVRAMLNDGRKVLGVRLSTDEPRYDIGRFESYFKAFFDLALSDPHYGAQFREYVKQSMDG